MIAFVGGLAAQTQKKDDLVNRYKGHHQLVLYDSTRVVMEESGLSHVYNHQRIKMLDWTGCKNNNVITIDYDPLSAYVEFLDVKIRRADGSVEVVYDKKKNRGRVYDYVAPARLIYWGASQKMVEVGHLNPYDEIDVRTYRKGYTYALLADGDDDARYIPPMKGHFYDIVPFWSKYPVWIKSYEISVLSHKNLRYVVYNGNLTTNMDIVDDRMIYRFVKHDIMPIKPEPAMVANNDFECKLILTTAPDWESKSMWFYGVNEDYGSFNTTPEVTAKVKELLEDAKDEQDSISILTHWVADNIRYAGISMGEGEGYTLHSAQMNFTDRCGVCKDKAGMLVAMLRAAGFESYACMTMAHERIEDIPADQFNHSVCVVKHRNGEFELLDPTWVPNVRELWSSAEQQQGYLMGLPEGAKMMYTPVSSPENHYIRIYDTCEVRRDGSIRGTLTITAEGQSDAAVRGVFRSRMSEWASNLEMEMLRIDPRVVVRKVTHTDNDRYLEQPVSITYEYEIPDYAMFQGEFALITPITGHDFFRRAMGHLYFDDNLKTRQYGFADRCSRLVETHDYIVLPYRYRMLFPSDKANNFKETYHRSYQGNNACYSADYNLDRKNFLMTFDQQVRFEQRVYEANDWEDFRQVVKMHKMAANEVLLVK